jgi:hypothetical protein
MSTKEPKKQGDCSWDGGDGWGNGQVTEPLGTEKTNQLIKSTHDSPRYIMKTSRRDTYFLPF